jgi:hypothetical protein
LLYRAVGEDVLLFRVSSDQGRTWSEEASVPGAVPRPLLNSHHFDKLGVATDADGRIILAFVGQDPHAPEGLSVFCMTYNRGEWSSPQAVASPQGFPEYPRLTVTHGNEVQLAYFVRDIQFVEGGHFVIWTTKGTTDAPTISPPPRPNKEPVAVAPQATPESGTDSSTSLPIAAFPTVPPEPAPLAIEDVDSMGRRMNPVSVLPLVLTVGLLLVAAGILLRVLKRVSGY